MLPLIPIALSTFVSAIVPVATGQATDFITGIAKDKFGVEIPDYWRIVNWPKRLWDMPLFEVENQIKSLLQKASLSQDQVTNEHQESLLAQQRKKNSVIEQDATTISKNSKNTILKSWCNSALTFLPLAALTLVSAALLPVITPTLIAATVALPAAVGCVTAGKEQMGRNLVCRSLYGLKIKADNPLTDPTNDPAYALFGEYFSKINPNISPLQYLQETPIDNILADIGDLDPLIRGKFAELKDSAAFFDPSKNVGGLIGIAQNQAINIINHLV